MLQPEVFGLLGTQERGAGGEIQLTDAMLTAGARRRTSTPSFDGRMFDCGAKEGFVQTNVAFALARADMRDLVLELIETIIEGKQAQRSSLILNWRRPPPT